MDLICTPDLWSPGAGREAQKIGDRLGFSSVVELGSVPSSGVKREGREKITDDGRWQSLCCVPVIQGL